MQLDQRAVGEDAAVAARTLYMQHVAHADEQLLAAATLATALLRQSVLLFYSLHGGSMDKTRKSLIEIVEGLE